MSGNKLGDVRRSHCIGNFGPGAIAEFRPGDSNGAAISALVCGLEEWDHYAPPAGLHHRQITHERRLESYLKVSGFRLPPVSGGTGSKGDTSHKQAQHVPAVRFPQWMQCPQCNRLNVAVNWTHGGIGNPSRSCKHCSNGRHKVMVSPVRFIVACTHGHLQEFPWERWGKHADGCKKKNFKLGQSKRAGLAGLLLTCLDCGCSQSMEGAFGKETMRHLGVQCAGLQPWLTRGNSNAECDRIPRAVQRGASNLYFPVVASALSIPPFTETIQVQLDVYWEKFVKLPEDKWPELISLLSLEADLGMTTDHIIEALRRSILATKSATLLEMRFDEYQKLGSKTSVGKQEDFDVVHERVPLALNQYFDKIVRVVRLREVRALRGFTRLEPPSGEYEQPGPTLAQLSLERQNWLPAIEVRGEGIFLQLNSENLKRWVGDPAHASQLQERARTINNAQVQAWKERHGAESEPPRTITPLFLLIHSFSHALMRQLTIASGYSSSALRERIYANDELGMAGVLIYTATTDTDGSLGGLERQGKGERMTELLVNAIQEQSWCSNDPLCIQDVATFSDPQNLAACHACMMVPETACEEFNVFLDRATLVGLPENHQLGFFHSILDPLNDI